MRAVFAVIGALIGACALSTGCLGDHEQLQTSQKSTNATQSYRPVRSAVDGKLQGEVGPMANLNHDANLLSAYDDGYYLSVETVVQLTGHAVMTLLSVSNGADMFQPGLDATFTLDNYDTNGVTVTMLGCVGQDVGVYDEYDMPADQVKVNVTQGQADGDMNVTLNATWFDRDQQSGAKLTTSKNAQTQFTLIR
jgi:hypothetical protein